MAKQKKASASRKTKKSVSKKKQSQGSVFWKLLKLLLLIVIIVFAVYVFYLDRQVVSKFSGKKWAVPAHVFARPLELYEGLSISPAHIVEEAKSLGYSENRNKAGSVVENGNVIHLYTRGFTFIDGQEKPQNISVRFSGNRIISIKDEAGLSVPLLRLEPLIIGGIYPDHNEDRLLVKFDQIPQPLIDTLLAVEDRNFYKHFGLSIRGTVRALLRNVSAKGLRQGGSTLTQQLVKNFYLTSERSFKRKAIEAIMAVLLEIHYSKEEILETYINEIYLGQNKKRAIHGFGLASYYYFNKPLSALELQEYALLVGIVKGPTTYNPMRRPKAALARRNQVLDILQQQKTFDSKQLLGAKNKPLLLGSSKTGLGRLYPAYLDLVNRQLKRDYKEKDLKTEGLRIFTNFDPQVQWRAEKVVNQKMQRMEGRLREKDRDQLQAAVVVLNPENGEVLAIVGDKKTQFTGFNRALDAQRPVGSVIKPAVYLAALQQKDKYSLATVLSDRKVSMLAGGERWEPKNFDKKEHGDVMLYRSLALSYNLSTINLGLDTGLSAVADVLQKLGVKGDIPEVPALLLGALDRSPYDVAEMYQTIAANGFYTPLRAIRDILDSDGKPLKRYPLRVEKRFDSDVMYLLQFAMHEVMRAGTAKSAYASISRNIELAGKTGTSNEQRDSWFAGFSANRLAVAWVGRDDNKPMPFSGSTGALPIWTGIMAGIQPRSLDLLEPENVHSYRIRASNGDWVDDDCPNTVMLPFAEGSEPKEQASCYTSIEQELEAEERELESRLLKAGKTILDWVSEVVQ